MAHTIEPELLSPTPRHMRYRDRDDFLLMLIYRFSCILLVGVGFTLFVYFCLQLTLGMTIPAEGKITQIISPQPGSTDSPDGAPIAEAQPRSGASPRVPTLEYTFEVDGRRIQGTSPIMTDQVNLLPSGETIKIRYIPFWPTTGHRPILPNDTFWGWVGIIGLITLLTNLVIGTLCWFAFALPRKQSELCRIGIPAPATIIRKEAWGANSSAFIVYYRFEPKADPKKRTAKDAASTPKSAAQKSAGAEALGEMRVPKEFWDEIDAGDTVTALYSPANPEINMLYVPGPFAIVPATYAAGTA